jgi:hypothetical protein
LSDESESSFLQLGIEDMYFEPHQYDRPIDKFIQSELNDLVRELQLTKEKSEIPCYKHCRTAASSAHDFG